MSQKNMGRLAQDMKREIIAIIGRLKDPRLEGGLLTVTRLDVTPDLDAVSYTHLGFFSAGFWAGFSSALGASGFFSVFFSAFFSAGFGSSLGAVSYTHLDVYKRQT